MEENQFKLKFSFTDEYSQTTETSKTINTCVLETYDDEVLPFLVDEFKAFLLGAGFSVKQVDCIEYKE